MSNDDISKCILLSKDLHQYNLLKKQCKRRALISTRRMILDIALNNGSINSTDTLQKNIKKTFKSTDVDQNINNELPQLNDAHTNNELNIDEIERDDLNLNNINVEEDEGGNLNNVNMEENEYVNSYDINIDKHVWENPIDYLDSCFTESYVNLHHLTNISKHEFCSKLLLLLRDAKMCKSKMNKLIHLIHSILPIPNNMPKSIKEILIEMQVQQLFVKRQICSTTERRSADVFDVNVKIIFSILLNRLWSSIEEYKKQINSKSIIDQNDIPFNILYQKMTINIKNQEFISIMLHVDGISICKSRKITLWLLSGVIIELPPNLRYRRSNMILLSIYIGSNEPEPKSWLNNCFVQLNQLKNEGVTLSNGIKCKILFYSIIADCPALKMILEFNGHTGYYCCFFCYIRGIHVGGRGGKRQYYYEDDTQLRLARDYAEESIQAARSSNKVFGHSGRSILHNLLDVPLPYSIICDYLHVTLLRHTRVIVKQIYSSLSPSERSEFDAHLREQKFPHIFNRKLRPINEFSFIKGTELKNLLLYGLIPHLLPYLDQERLAHVALFVSFIRVLHGKKYFGEQTSFVAKELFVKYYQDHEKFFNNLQDFTLHLHLHFDQLFDYHGSLCYLNTFGQEDFIGSISKNFHGTRFHGELITYYYEIDFALRNSTTANESSVLGNIDGPFDQTELTTNIFTDLNQHHHTICGCNKPYECLKIFRRCIIDKKIYHSLIYSRRNSSVSYFVQYRQNKNEVSFGKIKFFFTSNHEKYAAIEHYEIKSKFSDFFNSSSYYKLLRKSIDCFFFVLHSCSSSIYCVPITSIETYCIVFEIFHHIIVTPLSIDYEHD